MPEVTTCPDCDKKLKVPDALLGKKVKCPGCGEMFVAKADAAEDEPEQEQDEAPARTKPRKDAVTARKGAPARTRDEDEEDERPRGKSRKDEDDRPRAKAKRDEEDEDDRPRGKSRPDDDDDDRDRGRGRGVKRAEDLDDRPTRRSRDDDDDRDRGRSRHDDDDDDRRGRSRRDDDDDHRSRRGPTRAEQAKGWRGVSLGVYLMTIGNWLMLATIGIAFITAGVVALGAGGMITAGINGGLNDARNAMNGAMLVGVVVFILFCLMGLLYLGYFVLHMVGEGLWLQVPNSRGSGALRGMAIAAFACDGAAFLCRVLGYMAAYGGTNIGGLFDLLALLLNLGGFVCRCLFLRFAAQELRDEELGGKFLFYMISWFIFYALITISLTITICGGIAGVASSANNQNAGGAMASMGVMMIVMMFIYILMILVYAGLTAWFVLLLTRLRGAIARHVSKL